MQDGAASENLDNPTAPPHIPYGAPFSYNIPPGAESKESNTSIGVSMCAIDLFNTTLYKEIYLNYA